MLKRWSVIVGAAIVALVGFWAYSAYRMPPGVEPMGDESQTIAWVALVTSIVSLLTAPIGPARQLVDLREG